MSDKQTIKIVDREWSVSDWEGDTSWPNDPDFAVECRTCGVVLRAGTFECGACECGALRIDSDQKQIVAKDPKNVSALHRIDDGVDYDEIEALNHGDGNRLRIVWPLLGHGVVMYLFEGLGFADSLISIVAWGGHVNVAGGLILISPLFIRVKSEGESFRLNRNFFLLGAGLAIFQLLWRIFVF